MSLVSIYGRCQGASSWPRLTNGMALGLSECGRLAALCATDMIGHEIEDALGDGYDAPVGLYIGPPTGASVMQGRGMHRARLALIAANSSWVPQSAMQALERGAVTGYVATSPWATEMLSGCTTLPVVTAMPGVSDDFKPNGTDPGEGWRVLHMASTSAERKGTAKLIEAWARVLRAAAPVQASVLRLVCDGPSGFFDDAISKASGGDRAIAATYHLSPSLSLSEKDAADFYQRHHLVCQPSRAEGFGMVPLEARACGVPVVMTDNTGHQVHCYSREPDQGPMGVIIVKNGGLRPIDDGPGALAPDFATDDLVQALIVAHAYGGQLRKQALEGASWVRQYWSWRRCCERFVDDLVAREVISRDVL